jgi:hypothetical protein
MIEREDPFKINLGMFLALLRPLLETDVKSQTLINNCGDREEIVAYLVLNSGLMDNDAKLKKYLLHTAKITPKVARPTAATETIEDTAKVTAQNEQIAETLRKIFGSELATSPLAKQFESARYQLAVETLSHGLTDQTIFDRIAAPDAT